jgi:hypothetical protein
MHGGGREITRYFLWAFCGIVGGRLLTAYPALFVLLILLFPLFYLSPFQHIFQIGPLLQIADRVSCARFASSATGCAGTQTGLMTWLANGCRHRASTLLLIITLFFISIFFLGLPVVRLVDPVLIQRVIRGRMAWHGNVGGTYFYGHDGLCSTLRDFYPYIHIYCS